MDTFRYGWHAGRAKDEFIEDTQCQDAVIRRLEIIGEAARLISDETRTTYRKLPWNEMVGMRNIMIHEYDEIDSRNADVTDCV